MAESEDAREGMTPDRDESQNESRTSAGGPKPTADVRNDQRTGPEAGLKDRPDTGNEEGDLVRPDSGPETD